MIHDRQFYRRPLYQSILILLLLVTAGLCAIHAAAPVAAEPEALGSISGIVRDRAGTPISGIALLLIGNNVIGATDQQAITDDSGHYRFGLLPTGLYRIRIDDEAQRYPTPQYYEDAITVADATVIPVNGDDRTDVDLILQPGGEFRGQVTAEDGRPLANVAVTAYNRSSSSPVQRAIADVDGRYILTGLAAGFYYIEFTDLTQIHQTKFYGDATVYYQAIPIGVSAGGRVDDLNVRLTRGSTISGQIRGNDGLLLANMRVEARTLYHTLRGVAYTDANGAYLIGGLGVGRYRIDFVDPTGRYMPSLYSNSKNEIAIDVGERDAITGIDGLLVKGGVVQGLVTDETGMPLANARVRALPINSRAETRIAYTDDQGNYLLEGLSVDFHHIEFSKPEALHLRAYYSNATTLADATPITVFLSEILTNVNATLRPGGAITGTITTVDGSNLGRLQISAIPPSGLLTETLSVITTVIGSQLTYTLGGLPADAYLVAVQGLGTVEYHNNTGDKARATPVQVTTGQLTRDVNFVLGDNADLATISGTVRTPTGVPLPAVNVRVYCLAPCGFMPIEAVPLEPLTSAGTEPIWRYLRSTVTDAEGQYQLTGLQPQTYRLRFTPDLSARANRYALVHYENASDLATATDIELQPFMVRDKLDVTLTPGGAITGVVTLEDDQPLRGSELTFYFWDGYDWEAIAQTTTDQLTGAYVRPALQSGRYRVELSGSFGWDRYRYFYGNTTVLTAATDVAVTAGFTTTDINIQLTADAFLNAAITGTVTTDDKPLANIQVALYLYDELVSYTTTDSNGRYALQNLGENRYFVAFSDPTATYGIGYSRAMTTFISASQEAISVAANAVIPNVNAELTLGGTMQGQVVDAFGRGIGQVEIDLYTRVGTRWMKAIPTLKSNADGSYHTPGLLPGPYRLRFTDPFLRFVYRYYGDSPTLELSPNVLVRVGEATKGVNVMMTATAPQTRRFYFPLVAR